MLGQTAELRPEVRVLGCDPNRAGIEMALAHHDTAENYLWSRAEAKLLGAEEGSDRHIAAGF